MNPTYESSLKPALSILALNEDIKVNRLQINALIRKEQELMEQKRKLEAMLSGV